MTHRAWAWLALSLTVVAPAAGTAATVQDDFRSRAVQLLRRVPLIDGHNDLPDAIRERGGLDSVNIAMPQPALHTDLRRMDAGGLTAQFWAAYVPVSTMDGPPGPAAYAREQIELIHRLCRKYPGFSMALTAADIERNFKQGTTSCLIGIEGGHAIVNSLDTLRAFYQAGARYMTLTHWRTTDWADAATDTARYGGLSPFGEEVVTEMNRLGMLVDLSHVSDATMIDAMRVSRAPVIFSHSSVRAITNHVRNVPDSILLRVQTNGGVVMVNFNPPFVSEQARVHQEARDAAIGAMRAAGADSAAIRDSLVEWNARQPRATLWQVADHIDHIRLVAGVDHVGLGSDFDGIAAVPRGLEDVSKFPDLIAELLKRGWKERDVIKLLSGNVLRVMRKAEAVAGK
jgi:membrane dipeptidase